MPQPPISGDTAERLAAQFRAAEDRLVRGLTEAVAGRQGAAERRFRSLLAMIDAELSSLESDAHGWLTADVSAVYAAGGGAVGDFAWTAVHRDALQALVEQPWRDLLSATKFVRRDSKAIIRKLAADQAARTVLGEITASRAGTELAALIRHSTGLSTVRFADGSRHGLADFGDMTARTISANAYNAGSIQQMRGDRTEWAEVGDGFDCGWEDHNDTDKAAGTVRSIEDCAAHSLSHPRCARSFSPRPDVTNATEARMSGQFSPEEQARLAEEERARAATHLVTGQPVGHFSAAGRQPRTSRVPRQTRSRAVT